MDVERSDREDDSWQREKTTKILEDKSIGGQGAGLDIAGGLPDGLEEGGFDGAYLNSKIRRNIYSGYAQIELEQFHLLDKSEWKKNVTIKIITD